MYAQYAQSALKEVRVSNFIRVFHRWTSIAFTLVVAAIFAALAIGQEVVQWLYYAPLLPLFLLLVTGLYMFFLPYVMRARRRT
jgi:hypothetical protein